MTNTFPQALTIAGSDSGGGAGIQADLKTFQMRRVFGMSVITAITAQNTLGVDHIHMLPIDSIRHQILSVYADFAPTAVKLGMLGNRDIIECVAELLSSRHYGTLIVDPVMVAKGGAPLLERDAVAALVEKLLPITDILTPNLLEAEILTGSSIRNEHDLARAAETLLDCGVKTVIIKGGHSDSPICRDWVFGEAGTFFMEAPRFATPHTHGTGCTFSACIAAEVAKGCNTEDAVRTAKAFVTAAVRHPLGIGHGHGPTNHWAYGGPS